MKCPKCNATDHEEGAMFCHICGASLTDYGVEFKKKEEGLLTSSNNTVPLVRTFDVNGVLFNMIHVEGGTFMMGPPSEEYGAIIHQVTLDNFFIGEIPVTMELWNAVMGEGAWKWHPYFSDSYKSNGYIIENRDNISPLVAVSRVSWEECKEFIDEISLLTNTSFRFPTEAEWEYAAKGGKSSRNCKYSGTNSRHKVGGELHDPVKLGIPNELGIFDMSSGCAEWCYDWWHPIDNKATSNPKCEFNPNAPNCDRNTHIVRGGRVPVWDNRCIGPGHYYHDHHDIIGLRLVI